MSSDDETKRDRSVRASCVVFICFQPENTSKTKQKSNVWGSAPNPGKKTAPTPYISLSPAGPPEAICRFFLLCPGGQWCRGVPWFLTLENHQPEMKEQNTGGRTRNATQTKTSNHFCYFFESSGRFFLISWARFQILPKTFSESSERLLEIFRPPFWHGSGRRFISNFSYVCQHLGRSLFADFKIFRATFGILLASFWNSSGELFGFFWRSFLDHPLAPLETQSRRALACSSRLPVQQMRHGDPLFQG